MPDKIMTVSEIIQAIPADKIRQWKDVLTDDLYQGGFNPKDWTGEGHESLDHVLQIAFREALRKLYDLTPVLVTDDPEEE